MKRFSEILYDIYKHLEVYEEHEVFEDSEIRGWAINALRQFGNLVTVDKSSTVLIHNYKGATPYYFYSFGKAKKCGVTEYEVEGNPPQFITQTVMKIREETPIEQKGNVEYLNPEGKYKRITETLYLQSPNSVKATIVRGGDIELVSHINRADVCGVSETDKSYKYKLTGSRMAIREEVIDTDFESGLIYMEYRGYPTDDSGELLIKDGGNGKLTEYLFNHLMRRCLQMIWLRFNKDVVTRIQTYSALENSSLMPAMTALKAEGIAGGQYIPGIKRKNQRRFSRYSRF